MTVKAPKKAFFTNKSCQEDHYFEKSLKTPFSATCPAITFARPDKPTFTKSEDFEVKKTDFAGLTLFYFQALGHGPGWGANIEEWTCNKVDQDYCAVMSIMSCHKLKNT